MCRVAAFPPGFSRTEALGILANFENKNTDGTGSAYVRDGKLIVDRWAKSFSSVAKTKPLLGHMPYDGWTIAHLRAASHGDNKKENTHPFIIGPWAFIHNGIWSEHNLVRLALSKQVEFEGETDSEVAGHFWDIIGPKKFSETVDFSGVFMGLHRNGNLWVVKTSGDLEIKALKGEKVLLASEFDKQKYERVVESLHGWYQFDKNGKYVNHKENERSWSSGYPYAGSARRSSLGARSSTFHRGCERVVSDYLSSFDHDEDWHDDVSISNSHWMKDGSYSGD
jgi:hypothetical protein